MLAGGCGLLSKYSPGTGCLQEWLPVGMGGSGSGSLIFIFSGQRVS